MDVEIVFRPSGISLYHFRSGEIVVSPTRELLIATHNADKLLELRDLLPDLPFVLVSLSDFPDANPVRETGATFVENAALKASGYARQTQVLTLADDSGLEVDALDRIPGVHSARYLSEAASYRERMKTLLDELQRVGLANRNARFVAAIAIAEADGTIKKVLTGVCEGRIARAPRGTGGFGYDPIFIPSGFDLTFAELSDQLKNKISHRALALKQVRAYLQSLTRNSLGG